MRARSQGGGGARARYRDPLPAADDAAEEEEAAAAAARSGGLKRRPAATGRRRDELGGRPRLGAVRGSGPGVGGGGAAGGPRFSSAAAAVAMRGTAGPGPPGQGRLPGTRGLKAPPPPLLLLLALLPLLPTPGAAAAPASRPPALPPAAAGPSVSLYLSEDEVRRLIGEWGRLRQGGQVGPGPGATGPVRARWTAGGSVPAPGSPPGPGVCLLCWPGGVVPARPRPRASLPAYSPSRLKTRGPLGRRRATPFQPAYSLFSLSPYSPEALFPAAPSFFDPSYTCRSRALDFGYSKSTFYIGTAVNLMPW